MQYRLSSLIWLTALAALSIAAAKVAYEHVPSAYILIALLSVPFAPIGFLLMVLSGFMAFAIGITPNENSDRRDNLIKCFRMFIAGLVLTFPCVFFFTHETFL